MYQDRGLASDECLNSYKAHLGWIPNVPDRLDETPE